jgi:hypothetical protein
VTKTPMRNAKRLFLLLLSYHLGDSSAAPHAPYVPAAPTFAGWFLPTSFEALSYRWWLVVVLGVVVLYQNARIKKLVRKAAALDLVVSACVRGRRALDDAGKQKFDGAAQLFDKKAGGFPKFCAEHMERVVSRMQDEIRALEHDDPKP